LSLTSCINWKTKVIPCKNPVQLNVPNSLLGTHVRPKIPDINSTDKSKAMYILKLYSHSKTVDYKFVSLVKLVKNYNKELNGKDR
jgi:hypothetical protein